MPWSPAPRREPRNSVGVVDSDGITIDDGPVVLDDIEIIDAPQVVVEPELSAPVVVSDGPGSDALDGTDDETARMRAMFGPEMTAGVSVVILFIIFAIVLTGGAQEQPRDQDVPGAENITQVEPAVAPAAVTVEIGEAVTVERGE